ncbi:MAG: hypothetical protein GTN76_04285 [Candidatus Aenigmarchaeota archaeon]|nr:hypothetical protein [Candidatus Aenigmarchaeota archaeon]
MKIEEALDLVKEEIERAVKQHGGFNSPHEGYAVIKEELEEFEDELDAVKKGLEKHLDGIWQAVKLKHPEQSERLLDEAVQLTAMAVRFIMDFG